MSHEGETLAGPPITCTLAAQHEIEIQPSPRAVSSTALATLCHCRAATMSAAAHTGLCWLSTPFHGSPGPSCPAVVGTLPIVSPALSPGRVGAPQDVHSAVLWSHRHRPEPTVFPGRL